MIPVDTRKGQNIALFGLGGSGLASAEALMAGGAKVLAFDDNPQRVKTAHDAGVPTQDLRDTDFSAIEALVLAPGVPLTHPKPHWTARLAQEAGVPVIGDVALFADERRSTAPGAPFIAITGTNGKSTTTALISHILKHGGRDVQMGGNIGKAVLSLDPPVEQRHYVVECSSYQIDLAPNLDPDIGVLLNLAPDHLDRHGTMENYASIKKQLVAASRIAVIGVDDAHCSRIADEIEASGGRVSRISVKKAVVDGVFAKENIIFRATGGDVVPVASLENIATLRGAHNAQNACAAWSVCNHAGLTENEIQAGLDSFGGLAHRMEIIGHIGDIVFVNDSKATNADAAAMALSSFEKIHWIAGGLAKDGGIDSLRLLFERISRAYLIGEAAPAFAASLGSDVSFEIAGTMDVAVERAAAETRNAGGGVVLLSPACASFDQFPNFEARGEAFRQAVARLPGFEAYGESAG